MDYLTVFFIFIGSCVGAVIINYFTEAKYPVEKKQLKFLLQEYDRELQHNITGPAYQKIVDEIARIKNTIEQETKIKLIKCANCKKIIRSLNDISICNDCVVPAVLEFHAKAKYELNKLR